MLPERVSPGVVVSAWGWGTFLLYIALDQALSRLFGVRIDPWLLPVVILLLGIITHLVIGGTLADLGIRVSGAVPSSDWRRPIAMARMRRPVDLPIRLHRGRWVTRVISVTCFLMGLLVLVDGLIRGIGAARSTRHLRRTDLHDLQPHHHRSSRGGFCLRDQRRGDPRPGRPGPADLRALGRARPLRDRRRRAGAYEYFVLWDRAGRRRFKSFGDGPQFLRKADRARVIRALRARFPQMEKPEPDAEPARSQASSTIWDRELDG